MLVTTSIAILTSCLSNQARIVAMTCTHAAMTRSRLVELGFKYDRLVSVYPVYVCICSGVCVGQ